MDRTEELESQVSDLTRLVTDLRTRLLSLEGAAAATVPDGPRSRRDLLRLGGVAALGAVGAAALAVRPAAAATGSSLVLGHADNVAEAPTVLTADGGTNVPVQVLAVQSQSFVGQTAVNTANGGTNPFAGAIQGLGGAGSFEGVDGWASTATGFAVYGFTDLGTGVVGDSGTGVGLYARRSGRIRQDPRPAGLPNYAPTAPEQVRDFNGVLWVNNTAGGAAAAVWRRVNTVRVDAANGSGAAFRPFRILDTRSGSIKAANSTTVVTVAGQGTGAQAIPADAIGVIGNLTAVAYTGPGSLAIMPQGATFNPASDPSSLNFITGQYAIANSFTCGLNNGQLQVFVGTSSSHFIIDITAYLQ
jgi:hypothetical protein